MITIIAVTIIVEFEELKTTVKHCYQWIRHENASAAFFESARSKSVNLRVIGLAKPESSIS